MKIYFPSRLLGDPVAPECLPTTTSTTITTTTTTSGPLMTELTVFSSSSSAVLLSHLQTSHQGGVTVQTLVGVVTGALVILCVLVMIILALVVRKHNYLQKCSRSEDYILHSEEPVLAPSIPAPPPLPPSPLHQPGSTHLQPGDRPPLVDTVPPAWLDEIQNNPMFNRQKHKLEAGGPLRSISGNSPRTD